jgi:serine protease Do
MRSGFLLSSLVAGAIGLASLPMAPPAVAAGVADQQLPDLVAKLLQSCVNITTTRYKEVQNSQGKTVYVADAESNKKRAMGSGFIISPDGYVVTNKHVTLNGISYFVTLANGRQLPADLVAQASAADIAVLKIRSNETWTPVKLGDSDTLRQGDAVIAIGNPLGYQSTVTTGIISALNRDEGLTPFDDFIQTDAAINQGNSGGPLFNWKGEVIGINAAIYTTGNDTGNIGIGLAIPINDAKFVVQRMKETLFEGKKYRPAFLGAAIESVTGDLAAAYGLPGPWGAVVDNVVDGSPAAQVGLRAGDIITSVNGHDTKDSRALQRAIIETGAERSATLGVWRDGKQQSIAVTLADLPAGQNLPVFLGTGEVTKPPIPPEALVNFGLQLSPVTPELQAKYSLGSLQKGAVVTGVAVGSEAADRGVNAGVVIVQVRDTPVASPEELLKSVENERQRKSAYVPMLIADSDGMHWIPFALN